MEPSKTQDARHATVAVPQNEIARLLDELNSVTINLQDSTDGLREELRPILRNEPTGDVLGKESREASTDLGSFLMSVIARVEATNRTVTDSRSRLEL